MNLRSRLVEFITPTIKVGGIRFYCPTSFSAWRAKTLLTKEPETIAWIDSMKPSDVFYDIGANIGCYSLYAAKRRIKVVAIEPAASNYAVFIRNIELNMTDLSMDATQTLEAYNVGLHHKTGMGKHLLMRNTEAGRALHSLTCRGWQYPDQFFRQPVLVYSLDDLIAQFELPPPTHIKIDVDGDEHHVLSGATKALSTAQTLMVEGDTKMGIPKGFYRRDAVPVGTVNGKQEFNHFFERSVA